MKTLGLLLGSAARVDLLSALHLQTRPVGLRQVARIASIQPRSADLALRRLVEEKLVFCEASSAQSFYRLNRDHPDAKRLAAIFSSENQQRLVEKGEALNSRALQIVPFIAEATEMLSGARKSRS